MNDRYSDFTLGYEGFAVTEDRLLDTPTLLAVQNRVGTNVFSVPYVSDDGGTFTCQLLQEDRFMSCYHSGKRGECNLFQRCSNGVYSMRILYNSLGTDDSQKIIVGDFDFTSNDFLDAYVKMYQDSPGVVPSEVVNDPSRYWLLICGSVIKPSGWHSTSPRFPGSISDTGLTTQALKKPVFECLSSTPIGENDFHMLFNKILRCGLDQVYSIRRITLTDDDRKFYQENRVQKKSIGNTRPDGPIRSGGNNTPVKPVESKEQKILSLLYQLKELGVPLSPDQENLMASLVTYLSVIKKEDAATIANSLLNH